MPTHLELTLQRDIDEIRAGLVAMAGLAEQALRDCLRALLENQRQLAYAVILRDQFIDGKEKELDGLCQRFLARQQPVASILRFVYSSIKVNLELERVGDYAESIARQFLKLSQSPVAFPRERFIQIAHLSIPMLHDAIQAFVEQDEELARKTVEVEEAVDVIKSELNRDLVELFRKQEIPFEVLSPLMMIARRFERVSDQARNICMETLYLCTGEHPKHPGSDQVRVLFVDEHHEGLAPMAEAIAKGLGLPQFIFNSAGVDPKPMAEAAVRLMQEKGIDLSQTRAQGDPPDPGPGSLPGGGGALAGGASGISEAAAEAGLPGLGDRESGACGAGAGAKARGMDDRLRADRCAHPGSGAGGVGDRSGGEGGGELMSGFEIRDGMKRRPIAGWLMLFLALSVGGGCKPKGADGREVIQNKGSDTMVNLAQSWAEAYQKIEPKVEVEVSGGGTGVGIAALIKGTIHVATASRNIKEQEIKQTRESTGREPVDFVVGYDALAIFVHKDNPIEEITFDQLSEIFAEDGQITKWSQLGVQLPGRQYDEIVRVSRQSSSGTYEFLRERVLAQEDFKLGSRDMNGSKEVVELVAHVPSAIGYSGMGYGTSEVKMLRVSAKAGEPPSAPTVASVLNREYPIARTLHLYTVGEPEGALKEYIEWIMSDAGQAIVQQAGYVPLPPQSRTRREESGSGKPGEKATEDR